jgi:hypothetical protein
MAEIVRQAKRLGKVLVQPQCPSDRPADLRDFEAMGQADAEMVAIRGNEDLRLVAEAAESDGVDDPVAVALKDVTRAARPLVGLRVKSAA